MLLRYTLHLHLRNLRAQAGKELPEKVNLRVTDDARA